MTHTPNTVRLFAFLGALLAAMAFSAPQVSHAQSALFQGTVLADDSTEHPLRNAEVVFPALKRAVRSDSLGRFRVIGVPFGKHAIVVRMLGYEPISTVVTISKEAPPPVDLLLKRLTTKLAEVETKAVAPTPYSSRLLDFEERRKMGVGKFLTADVFRQNEGLPLSSFVTQKIPTMRIVQANGRRYFAATRGPGINQENCYMQVVINGIVRYNGSGFPTFEVDELNTKDIIGFEFYTTASTPMQFNQSRASSCGTVIIWTK